MQGDPNPKGCTAVCGQQLNPSTHQFNVTPREAEPKASAANLVDVASAHKRLKDPLTLRFQYSNTLIGNCQREFLPSEF
jgi:hypothetical protein